MGYRGELSWFTKEMESMVAIRTYIDHCEWEQEVGSLLQSWGIGLGGEERVKLPDSLSALDSISLGNLFVYI